MIHSVYFYTSVDYQLQHSIDKVIVNAMLNYRNCPSTQRAVASSSNPTVQQQSSSRVIMKPEETIEKPATVAKNIVKIQSRKSTEDGQNICSASVSPNNDGEEDKGDEEKREFESDDDDEEALLRIEEEDQQPPFQNSKGVASEG